MPFTFTAAHSSRITKRKPKNPAFDRSSSSFTRTIRHKPGQILSGNLGQKEESEVDDDDEFDDRLDDLGIVTTLATDISLRDVVPTMKHVCANMFDEIPEQRSGMNSTRIAEVLNFRKSLPQIVSNAHVHALVKSPTLVEKEIAQLHSSGLLGRITVPGRGLGASSISDGLIIMRDWVAMVQEDPDLNEALKEKYTAHIQSSRSTASTLIRRLTEEETTLLMRKGFLTSSMSNVKFSSNVLSRHRNALAGTLASIDNVSKAASGSVRAVGGQNAVLISGGGGSAGLEKSTQSGETRSNSLALRAGIEMKTSVPGTGMFLKLVQAARSHLLFLLSKSKYREGPLYLLRERWDGNTSTKAAYGRSKDPFSQVLPGKTKKWKEFYGLKFDWVLAECLGGGLVEVFETGSVGLGVRTIN